MRATWLKTQALTSLTLMGSAPISPAPMSLAPMSLALMKKKEKKHKGNHHTSLYCLYLNQKTEIIFAQPEGPVHYQQKNVNVVVYENKKRQHQAVNLSWLCLHDNKGRYQIQICPKRSTLFQYTTVQKTKWIKKRKYRLKQHKICPTYCVLRRSKSSNMVPF